MPHPWWQPLRVGGVDVSFSFPPDPEPKAAAIDSHAGQCERRLGNLGCRNASWSNTCVSAPRPFPFIITIPLLLHYRSADASLSLATIRLTMDFDDSGHTDLLGSIGPTGTQAESFCHHAGVVHNQKEHVSVRVMTIVVVIVS